MNYRINDMRGDFKNVAENKVYVCMYVFTRNIITSLTIISRNWEHTSIFNSAPVEDKGTVIIHLFTCEYQPWLQMTWC